MLDLLVRRYRILIVIAVILLAGTANANSEKMPVLADNLVQAIIKQFKGADSADNIGKYIDSAKVWPVLAGSKILGYVFETRHSANMPAYSGKPINLLVAIDTAGVFRYAWVLEHHEPILLVGIPEQKLQDFAGQYPGKKVTDRIQVGSRTKSKPLNVDAISGATVTVLVVNETILKASRLVARQLGLIKQTAQAASAAVVKKDVFQKADWTALVEQGAFQRLNISRGMVDKAFVGTPAENVERASQAQKADVFIDLHYTYLNAPTAGINLLGKDSYQWLMAKLKKGEHAIAVMGQGEYSFKGSGYVRGGIFDRISVIQNEGQIHFRDVDHYRLADLYAQGAPEFSEMAIFIIRDTYQFDPGQAWKLQLLVRRQTGALSSEFAAFRGDYRIPESFIERQAVASTELDFNTPLWVSIWQQRLFQIIVLSISLLLLTVIIFSQEVLAHHPGLLHKLRLIFLTYTVVFIGWYALGQLSIVNVFTFSRSLTGEFQWTLFLMDPIIFILWTYAAVSILLWGRGIYCGWLCPFGALQELINELARKLKVKQRDLPFSIHEKLWSLKYIILLVLFGVSMESMSTAEKLAEVEPFKTSILLFFQREWWFVSYALILLFVSIFTRKVFCRYLCPLGAALSVATKFRLFDWLKRRPECGNPCKVCANECEIRAIHPDGRINAHECHHCLDCQVTYYDQNKCPPLVNKAKKLKKKVAVNFQKTAI